MSESNHVGPIIFANETARGQLIEHGEVVSFRVSDRTTGDTWWRESRTGPKQGDVHVEQIAEDVDVLDLAEHADLSGFESVEDWQDAIRDVHGEVARQGGYLYRVTERDADE